MTSPLVERIQTIARSARGRGGNTVAPHELGPAPSIAIIGAGFSGIGMAIRLKQQGIESFTVFEKATEVGGVWRDNTYPGAGCDVPSHLYSYSFERRADWTRKFPKQPEILDYLGHCVRTYHLEDRTGALRQLAGR